MRWNLVRLQGQSISNGIHSTVEWIAMAESRSICNLTNLHCSGNEANERSSALKWPVWTGIMTDINFYWNTFFIKLFSIASSIPVYLPSHSYSHLHLCLRNVQKSRYHFFFITEHDQFNIMHDDKMCINWSGRFHILFLFVLLNFKYNTVQCRRSHFWFRLVFMRLRY